MKAKLLEHHNITLYYKFLFKFKRLCSLSDTTPADVNGKQYTVHGVHMNAFGLLYNYKPRLAYHEIHIMELVEYDSS